MSDANQVWGSDCPTCGGRRMLFEEPYQDPKTGDWFVNGTTCPDCWPIEPFNPLGVSIDRPED